MAILLFLELPPALGRMLSWQGAGLKKHRVLETFLACVGSVRCITIYSAPKFHPVARHHKAFLFNCCFYGRIFPFPNVRLLLLVYAANLHSGAFGAFCISF